jgi:hypothetical protein
MIINDSILKNEKLSTQMKILNKKINELEQYYYSINMGKATANLRTSVKHQLNRAKSGFLCVSEAYTELNQNQITIETTDTLVKEAHRYCEDVDIYLFRINNKRF